MKIEIKSVFGIVLFQYEKENNTIKETIIEAAKAGANLTDAVLTDANLTGSDLTGAFLRGAVLRGANLRGADLRGADLRGAVLTDANLTGANITGANLRGAVLRGANLRGAVLTGANITGANLRGAVLRGANLRGAVLRGANLRGADLTDAVLTGAIYKEIKIKKIRVITGMYKYIVFAVISESGEKWVRLGCHFRKLEDWNSNFWNNDSEFPNNGSIDSEMRLLAFEFCKKWFELNEKD